MTILVTGGAGYIGSHTCIELIKANTDKLEAVAQALIEFEKIDGKHFEAIYNATDAKEIPEEIPSIEISEE